MEQSDRDKEQQFHTIVQLERAGQTLRAIALHAGVSKSTVGRWKAGQQAPTYVEWQRVLTLHATFCPTPETELSAQSG